jgi:lipopolysaccharide/colanic/teichoic acid biosynthesis glycosyltransferase/dTDP-glucose pyrophosphorylase
VLYRCRRVGRGGREFAMLKFRKMRVGAGGPPLRAPDDDRYTRFGRVLASTRIDELPQLLNVLRGQMSLVGPRPEDPAFVALRRAQFERVLRVRPGLTGLSQLAYAREDVILAADDREGDYIARVLPQKLALDALYAERGTFAMDLRIIAWTVVSVLLGRDIAVHRQSGSLGRRRRPADDEVGPIHSHAPPAPGRPRHEHGIIKPVATPARLHDDLRDTRVVILAGGRGTRLAPYTSILPKPLMPIGDRSILEIVIEQLADAGARHVTLSVGYLSHLIQSVLAHRTGAAVEVEFVHERDALGTAAPLRLVDGLDRTFMFMNGDILTTLDYRELLRRHRESGNLLTIATRDRRIKIDYGMLHLDSADRLQLFEEKPELVSPVSMGIYVMEPEALAYVPPDGRFDVPDLVQTLLASEQPVGAYRFDGLWFDIGRPSDYEEAVSAWLAGAEDRVRARSAA